MANAKKKPGNRQSARDAEYQKRPGETALQYQSRIARYEQGRRDADKPIVSIEAARHGAYVDEFIHHDESGSKTQTKKNLNASPLIQWRAQGMLEPHHEDVIKLCLHLWEFLPPMPTITGQYGERIPGNDTGEESEHAVNAAIDAKDKLARIQGYFPDRLRHYWSVFENCIRHDMPAGVAGGDLGFTSRSGRAKAHVIVCFVCDKIADKEGL